MKIPRLAILSASFIIVLVVAFFAYIQWHHYHQRRVVPQEDTTYYKVLAAITQRDKNIRFNRMIETAKAHPIGKRINCENYSSYRSLDDYYNSMYEYFNKSINRSSGSIHIFDSKISVIPGLTRSYNEYEINKIKKIHLDVIELSMIYDREFLYLLHCAKKKIR